MSFLSRNLGFCLGSPRKAYKTQKAMDLHREEHPECQVCGIDKDPVSGRKCDVHHIVPIHIAPELADDPKNLVTLCRFHHWWVGHLKNWRKFNTNLTRAIRMVRYTLYKVLEIGVEDDGKDD